MLCSPCSHLFYLPLPWKRQWEEDSTYVYKENFPFGLLSPLSYFRMIQMGFVLTQPHSHILATKFSLLGIHQALIPAGKLCSHPGLASSTELLPKVKVPLGRGSYTGQDEEKGHFPGSSSGVLETKST